MTEGIVLLAILICAIGAIVSGINGDDDDTGGMT